jgi:rhodanese-related sulfurtransferase
MKHQLPTSTTASSPARPPRRRTRRLTTLGLAGALTLSAVASVSSCSSEGSAPTGSSQAVAAQHRSPQDFAAAASQPGTVVLDVRTPAEFAAGHLAGAVNIDSSSADFRDRLASLDQGRSYAVYCHSGRRSAAALDVMSELGFTKSYDLAGGMGAWVASGGQVVTGS